MLQIVLFNTLRHKTAHVFELKTSHLNIALGRKMSFVQDIHFLSFIKKRCHILDQNVKMYKQFQNKTTLNLPFAAAHTLIAHVRKSPSPPPRDQVTNDPTRVGLKILDFEQTNFYLMTFPSWRVSSEGKICNTSKQVLENFDEQRYFNQ